MRVDKKACEVTEYRVSPGMFCNERDGQRLLPRIEAGEHALLLLCTDEHVIGLPLREFGDQSLALLRHFKPARFEDMALQKMSRELEAIENVFG